MVKRKKRIIMYVTIILMMTIGMLGIGEITLAENQPGVKEQNNDVSAASDETPKDYFILEEISGKPNERSIKFNKDATPAITEVVIPAEIDGYTITSIGDSAFSWCNSLTTITIPDSVTSIGKRAFYNCTALTTITIPDSVTSIGSSAFYNCTALTTVTIPDSVTSIGDDAFEECTALTTITIPDSVTSLGDGAFYECTALTTITISDSVTSIGDHAFAYSGLTIITIPDSVTSIENGAFYNCTALTTVTIPDSVTSIGNRAFRACTALTTITIPDGVTKIEEGTFDGCSQLTAITIPERVTSIGNEAFFSCTALTTITIPETVTSIGNRAFAYSRLTTITIPYGVTEIEEGTFEGCSRLTTITIPETVTSIGNSAFAYSRLTTITIPETVTSIEKNTFARCSSLETVAVHDTLTSLDTTAFSDSAVKNLIFICQDKDNMDISEDVVNNVPESIAIYRVAADKEIKTDYSEIKSYELIGETLSVGDIFKDRSGVIYNGKTGTDEYEGEDIKIEDYFDMTLTYELLGNPESDDTKLEDGILHIGEDEISDDLKIKASTSDLEKEIDIQIMKVQSVEIKKEPENTYDEGEQYNPEGLVITVTYEDREDVIEYSEDSKKDFTFANNPLAFGTKEQVITYKGYEMKQSLIIYGSQTLKGSNIEVRGKFTYESLLEVGKTEIDNDLKDKEIIAGYDIKVNGNYKNTLTIIFDIGDKYSGKKINIRHNGNATEEYGVTVNEGKVSIEVNDLSPFIIYTDKELNPIIKPIKPTPDTPVQTKPNQNQQNTVSTEDNNHLLLWGGLGIVSISMGIMSVKKKSRIKSK